jgi:uncharacterized membrane protein YfcA
MDIYLPIAGMSVDIFLILGLGGLVGFLSGIFGVGGGFLLTPLLIMIGIPPAVAAASGSNQFVASSASGAYAYKRAGNVDIKLGSIIFAGGIVGSTVGVQVVKLLRLMGDLNFAIKITYVVVLGGIGAFMFIESLTALTGKVKKKKEGESAARRLAGALPFQMEFKASNIRVSIIVPFLLGFVVGFLGAIMGVGGGFIMLPAMIYILGMPTVLAIGTDLFQIVITSISTTIQQAMFNHTVDVGLALLLLFGSTVGAQFGVKASKKLRAEQLRILLALIVLMVMGMILYELIAPPSELVSLAVEGGGGH